MIAKEKYTTHQTKYEFENPVLLDCPNCQHFLSAKNIDIETGTGDCSNCNHKFDIQAQQRKDPYRRPEIIMPLGVEVLKLRSFLEVEIDWYRSAPKRQVQGLLSSAFIWNLLILPFVIVLALNGELFVMLLLSGHLLAGFALLWQLIATLVNKTTIKVGANGITIMHGPMRRFGKGNRTIPRQDIIQLYVNRYTIKIGKKPVQAYALSAILKGNKVIKLVEGMDRETQLYIEQELETYLQIRDAPVQGEVPRNA